MQGPSLRNYKDLKCVPGQAWYLSCCPIELSVSSDLLFFLLGVYFTSIDPYHDPKSILLNNYDDAGRVINSKRLWAKIEWVIEVSLPMHQVVKVEGSNRDVYLFVGDVDLGKYQYRIYSNPGLWYDLNSVFMKFSFYEYNLKCANILFVYTEFAVLTTRHLVHADSQSSCSDFQITSNLAKIHIAVKSQWTAQ